MKRLFTLAIFGGALSAGRANAQLYISAGSTFTIQSTGVVTVQGDVTGLTDIQGGGKVLLKGSANQNVNMNGFTIPNLEMDNAANATLTGNTRIGSSLLFTNGKILAGNYNLNLADVATATGGGTSKFVETSGTGQVIKELSTNVTSSEIPVGAGTIYRPAFLTTSGTYSSASVGFKVLAMADPNRPYNVSDYINAYWPITRTGVTGTVNVAGKYDATDLAGTSLAANLAGYFYTPTDWNSAGETHTPASFLISAPISAATGDITGIDKFSLVGAKAFLQGAYITGGTMNDGLRTPTNLIPLSDPYRTPAYSTAFTRVSDSLVATASASVFTDQTPSTNNIVDWVFLELRNNASPGNTILQTRSALIRKDGMIVDVDGVSPVTFNKIPNGNYTVVVRHRNHLGLGTNPLGVARPLSDVKSAVTLIDFSSSSAANLFGTAAVNYALSADATPKNLLFGGNANSNTNVKVNGGANDKDAILITALSNNSGAVLNNIYSPADVNMNRVVKYNGGANDKDFIINTVLLTNSGTVRLQALPN